MDNYSSYEITTFKTMTTLFYEYKRILNDEIRLSSSVFIKSLILYIKVYKSDLVVIIVFKTLYIQLRNTKNDDFKHKSK